MLSNDVILFLRQKGQKSSSFSLNDLLRRFSGYEDVKASGYSGSKRDFVEYIDYAQRLVSNQLQRLTSVSRPGPCHIILNLNAFNRMI